VLSGPRGTGKTVMLAEIERHLVDENRALILNWSGTESLHDRVTEQAPQLREQLRSLTKRGLRRLDREVSVRAAPGGIGVEARFSTAADRVGMRSVHAVLEQLARAAADRGRIVVLVADELHVASVDDLRQLGVSIQEVANTRQLPLALVGAGLPQTQQAFQGAQVTFLERLDLTTIGLLDDADTRDALEIPFTSNGRRVTASALDVLTSASGGYPYAIQLIGSYCWKAAGDAGTVGVGPARLAAQSTADHLERTVFATTWQRLSPADREVVVAAAEVMDKRSDSARIADIAAHLGRPITSISPARDRLINRHGVMYAVERGTLKFSLPGFSAWISRLR
jgi:DNA polymerase III delta prime subunit